MNYVGVGGDADQRGSRLNTTVSAADAIGATRPAWVYSDTIDCVTSAHNRFAAFSNTWYIGPLGRSRLGLRFPRMLPDVV